MKKIILLLSIVLLASCSKSDDDTPKTLPLNFQNLAGQWNFKTVIRANGTEVPFVGRCPTQIDYIEAFSYGKKLRITFIQIVLRQMIMDRIYIIILPRTK